MENEEDLAKQCVPISKLEKNSTEWVIKVLVIRRGLIKDYNNANGGGVHQLLIFVDEEGTKIQATLFNNHVQTWKELFEPNKAYYIKNGRVTIPKPDFASVNSELQITFSNYTTVKECNSEFLYQHFSDGFVPFDKAEKFTDRALFDVVGILIKVKPLIVEGSSKRRELILTDERFDRKTLTLWADLAEFDGETLQSLENSRPVVAFCDVKGDMYKGDFSLKTTPVSSVILNPKIERANDLLKWYENMKAEIIDISLMPSRLIQEATEVTIGDIMDGSIAKVKDVYFKFNAQLAHIITKNEPWYPACHKCYRRVSGTGSSASCIYCKKDSIGFSDRYRLKIDVPAGVDQWINITLFDAAQYFFGCDVKEYIQSTVEKKEESRYHRKMELSLGKEFTFLVKNDPKIVQEGWDKSLIAYEMHEVGKPIKNEANVRQEGCDKSLIDDEMHEVGKPVKNESQVGQTTVKLTSKRSNKLEDDEEQKRVLMDKKIKLEKD